MKSFRTLSVLILLVSMAAGIAPVLAGEHVGRNYSLNTLDYREAENLAWEICETKGGGKSDKCAVQHAGPGGLSVFATQEIHAEIVKMLLQRDPRIPSSLLFEIVLVRLAEKGGRASDAKLAPHHARALEAVAEMFPTRRPEIIDTGLIRTVEAGSTHLGGEASGAYSADLNLARAVSGRDGMEFVVELRINKAVGEGYTRILESTLTIGEGETVVAGSSRFQGDAAVVVLLTSRN